MDEKQIARLLEDESVLLEAHAASSAYVMRQAFQLARPLREFIGHPEIGGELANRIVRMTEEAVVNPVALSAHVYALELTGAKDELRSASKAVLATETLRADGIVGQFVGLTAERILHPRKRISAAEYLEADELERLAEAL